MLHLHRPKLQKKASDNHADIDSQLDIYAYAYEIV